MKKQTYAITSDIDIVSLMHALLAERDMSILQLARRANVPQASVYDFMRYKGAIRSDSLFKLLAVLNAKLTV